MSLFFNPEEESSLFRVGEVCYQNPKNYTVRVCFEDKDDMVSGELQVVNRNTFKNKDYGLPDLGEQVFCIFLENGIEKGFVLGAIYSSAEGHEPPIEDKFKRHVTFEDGAFVEYDRKNHIMKLQCPGKIEIVANEINVHSIVTINGDLKTVPGPGPNLIPNNISDTGEAK